MCFWLWPRESRQSLSLWVAFGEVSTSFARAAEPAARTRAVARAIVVLVNIVVSPLVCCTHPAGVGAGEISLLTEPFGHRIYRRAEQPVNIDRTVQSMQFLTAAQSDMQGEEWQE